MDRDIELAEQQLLGFAHAKKGFSIVSLIESMGLNESEWTTIHNGGFCPLDENDIDAIDEYFENKAK